MRADTRGKRNVIGVQLHAMGHVGEELIRLPGHLHDFSDVAHVRYSNLHHHEYRVATTLSHAQILECDVHIAR